MAIDPDNTDGYQATSGTGFGTTEADTLDFLTFLSNTARAAGLGIGLKNTLALITNSHVGLWDFAVNEQCSQYTECNYYSPFQAGTGCATGSAGAPAMCGSPAAALRLPLQSTH